MDNTEIKVLLLYGGPNANGPRDALLTWLNSPEFHKEIGRKVDARKVADMPAHMEDSIDIRVQKAIDWADKGIALLTPDSRGTSGAPNVVEEFGRWIGQKGRRSMATIRHKDVEVHSNASGLVYIGFEHDVIAECRNKIVAFIVDPLPAQASRSVAEPSPVQQQQQPISTGPTFNIQGGVGGDLTAGDKIGGNVYHVTGDLNINQGSSTPASSQSSLASSADSQAPTSGGNPLTISTVDLKEFLDEHFSTNELKELCFHLNIDSEEFGASKSMFVIQFITFLQRRDRFEDLVKLLVKERGPQLEKKFKSQNITVSDS